MSIALSSSEWQDIPRQIKDRATFSAKVHNARFLSVVYETILTTLARWARARNTSDFQQARAQFVEELSRVAIEEGMGPLTGQQPGIEDISSATRLKLIFDTLTRSAYGYANYAWQLQNQHDYPAARFIRHPGAKTKRPLHQQNENVVRLFTDLQFWLYMNNRQLGGFEVPWPPYGYNSWMDRIPIPRQQAISLGLISDQYQPSTIQHPGFNDNIAVDVSNVPPDILKSLRKVLSKTATLSRGHLIFHPTSRASASAESPQAGVVLRAAFKNSPATSSV